MAYDDAAHAQDAAALITTKGQYMRAYYNEACGWWHLSSQLRPVL